MTDLDELKAELEEKLKHSQDVFQLEAGGKSQCEVGRCRVPSLAVKQAEGSMHALIDLIRLVDRDGDDRQQLLTDLSRLKEKWLAVSQLSGQWKAYRQSGLDEVRSVIEVFSE